MLHKEFEDCLGYMRSCQKRKKKIVVAKKWKGMKNPGWSESVVKHGILGTPTVNDLEERTLKERAGQKSHGAKDLYISRCANVGKISSEVWNLEGCNGKTLYCGYYSR